MKKNYNLIWKIAGTAYLSLVLLATPFNAHAYIDPSVSSYLIQAIIGVAVAVGAFVAVYWRRAKKKGQDKLGIQESSRKEKEEDVQLYDGKNK